MNSADIPKAKNDELRKRLIELETAIKKIKAVDKIIWNLERKKEKLIEAIHIANPKLEARAQIGIGQAVEEGRVAKFQANRETMLIETEINRRRSLGMWR